MSASLVGSEMCIRDRCMLVGARRRPIALATSKGRSRLRRARRARLHGAVSYTHLTLPTICSV
eukprot:5638556-Alexandrium_andersonii.AAC.1